jgi:hypothetical protein
MVPPSPVDGHLGCSHFWAIVNYMAVNRGAKNIFESLLSIILGLYWEVGLLGRVVMVVLRNHYCFLRGCCTHRFAASFSIPFSDGDEM